MLETEDPDVEKSLTYLSDIRDIRTKTTLVNKAKRTVEALVLGAQGKLSRVTECEQEIELLEKERCQLLNHLQQIEADTEKLKACVDAEKRGSQKILGQARFVLEETYHEGKRELDELRAALGLPPAQSLDLKEADVALVLSVPLYKPMPVAPASTTPGEGEPAPKRKRSSKGKK